MARETAQVKGDGGDGSRGEAAAHDEPALRRGLHVRDGMTCFVRAHLKFPSSVADPLKSAFPPQTHQHVPWLPEM